MIFDCVCQACSERYIEFRYSISDLDLRPLDVNIDTYW